MNKYGIFVASTFNYIGYLNALLNSIEKRGLYRRCDLTVHVYYHMSRDGKTFPQKYLDDIQSKFSFKVIPDEIKRSDIDLDSTTEHNEFVKRARYAKIMTDAIYYDAVCLLDCDMFIVSDQFYRLFNIVKGTYLLIGCNERFKWPTDDYFYKLDSTPSGATCRMLPKGTKLYNMICNTPAIFDMKAWFRVFEKYADIAKNGRKYQNGDKNTIVGVGDLFCWNLAIQSMDMQDLVICFPMETMAQVHQTSCRTWTHIIVEDDYWRTFAGDRVYVIHGRIADGKCAINGRAKYRQIHEGMKDAHKWESHVVNGLKACEKEWYDLNYNQTLKLIDYMPEDPVWRTLNGE